MSNHMDEGNNDRKFGPWDDDYDEPGPWDDDEDEYEDEDKMLDCGFIPGEGICIKAGTEWCDWECPYNPCDPVGM